MSRIDYYRNLLHFFSVVVLFFRFAGKEAWKIPVGLEPLPPKYYLGTLPTELWSLMLGGGDILLGPSNIVQVIQ